MNLGILGFLGCLYQAYFFDLVEKVGKLHSRHSHEISQPYWYITHSTLANFRPHFPR